MIVFFKVRNFESIKDTLTLSFLSTSISEHNDSNVVLKGRDELLRSLVLYGHNASGKSNILDAVAFYRWFIVNSATELQSNDEIEADPFRLNSETEKAPSFFEMCFYIGNVKYRYGFESTKERVTKEWLLETKKIKEYPVFLRINDDFQIDEKRIPGALGVEKRTRKNALFISACSQWNVKKAQKIFKWFDDTYTVHGLMDNSYRDITLELLENKKYSRLINRFLRKADLGINGVNIIDIKLEDIIDFVPEELKDDYKEKFKDGNNRAVLMSHDKFDKNNKKIDQAHFLLEKHESEGTKKFFNLIGVYVKAIIENRFLIIDEFDARLHTLLTKAILKLFNSSKVKSESQLLVAAHDTALLDKRILRRDQICFVEKNKYGSTEMISLVEYKPRKESPFDRNYLDGKYGGIPIIEDLEELF
ncbi:ATP-binding protein [Flavobacteriaceae bacterium F89]|uniref:ATP-binding protein n=1 Tax=Cerina litoralis TaxID=2874477 RepID=A0AAE3JSW3_9FLAO|nr:ATP-binding protein [Cerina litoralis]MCG2462943.1 ATP-binding protein [Cerina litoralis]